MGIELLGPPYELVHALREAFAIDTFVETGTLHGGTTLWASQFFANVFTIEASESLHAAVQPRFVDHPNITSLLGHTGLELQKLLPSLPRSILFLDAHWSGGVTAGELDECPLLTELELIMPWMRRHVVLIDDARMFMAPPQAPHRIEEWPSLDDIIRTTSGNAYVAYYRDVLVLVPNAARAKTAALLQNLINIQQSGHPE